MKSIEWLTIWPHNQHVSCATSNISRERKTPFIWNTFQYIRVNNTSTDILQCKWIVFYVVLHERKTLTYTWLMIITYACLQYKIRCSSFRLKNWMNARFNGCLLPKNDLRVGWIDDCKFLFVWHVQSTYIQFFERSSNFVWLYKKSPTIEPINLSNLLWNCYD